MSAPSFLPNLFSSSWKVSNLTEPTFLGADFADFFRVTALNFLVAPGILVREFVNSNNTVGWFASVFLADLIPLQVSSKKCCTLGYVSVAVNEHGYFSARKTWPNAYVFRVFFLGGVIRRFWAILLFRSCAEAAISGRHRQAGPPNQRFPRQKVIIAYYCKGNLAAFVVKSNH